MLKYAKFDTMRRMQTILNQIQRKNEAEKVQKTDDVKEQRQL